MGYYIFEGIDGSGKTVQADMLTMLRAEMNELPYLRINEPDDTSPIGKLLREFLKYGDHPRAHAAMFLADRMALQYAKILPALQKGYDVIQT